MHVLHIRYVIEHAYYNAFLQLQFVVVSDGGGCHTAAAKEVLQTTAT